MAKVEIEVLDAEPGSGENILIGIHAPGLIGDLNPTPIEALLLAQRLVEVARVSLFGIKTRQAEGLDPRSVILGRTLDITAFSIDQIVLAHSRLAGPPLLDAAN